MWQRGRRTCFLTDHNLPHPVTWANNNNHGSNSIHLLTTASACQAGGWTKKMSHRLWHPNSGESMHIKKSQREPSLNQDTHSPLLVNSLLEMLASATKQEKEMRGINIEKEAYTALFTDNILCTQKTQNDLPITIKIPKCMQQNIRNKVNIQKSIIHSSNKQKIKKIKFAIAYNIGKYPGPNIPKEV